MKINYVTSFSDKDYESYARCPQQKINIDGEILEFPLRLNIGDSNRHESITFTGFKRSENVAFGNEDVTFFTYDTKPHWDHVTTQERTYSLSCFKEALKTHKELEK